MRKPWRLDTDARRDVAEAANWHEAKEAGLGVAFAEVFGARLEAAEERPGMATQVILGGEAYRRVPLRGLRYSIWAIELESAHLVLAVSHQRRDNAHWLGRDKRSRKR